MVGYMAQSGGLHGDLTVAETLAFYGAIRGIEGFGPQYDLPNKEAYDETCAAVGNVLFNYRMFLLNGDAKYLDVAEVLMVVLDREGRVLATSRPALIRATKNARTSSKTRSNAV